jgi:hypothetical protein
LKKKPKGMNREIYFLDHPDAHVAYRDARIQDMRSGSGPKSGAAWLKLWREELLGAVAAYSRGDDLEMVNARYLRCAEACIHAANAGAHADLTLRDDYHLVLWTFSLAMITGIEPIEMGSLANSLDFAGKDALLDCLLNVVFSDVVPSSEYLHEGPFHHLVAAAGKSGEEGAPHVQKYLLAYLPELEKLSWYETHIKQLPEFFGYWAFEVAAVVKAFHISDRLFADHIFYPRDLVRQRLFRTWSDNSDGDQDRKEIDTVLDDEETKAALESLAGYFQNHYGGDGKEIPDALNMLSKLSGKSSEDLKDDPEMMQQIVSKIFRGVIKANTGLQEVLGGEDLSPEAEELLKNLKLDDLDTGGLELDGEAIRKEGDKGDPEGKTGAHYAKISEHLGGILEKEKEGQLAFVEGLEKLVEALGLSVTGDHRDVKKEVSDKISAELREQRKGKNLKNFDWSSLMPGKEED